jgi:hypothetical protein
MTRVVTFAAMAALVGCATQLQVVGPYAGQLSQSDIQQITALITRSGIASHVYTRLDAVRPDEVRVKYGGYGRSLEGGYTSDPAAEYFTAFKRHGRWVAGGESGVEARITVY